MINYNYPIEASVLLDTDGVSLYFSDDEIPTASISLVDMVKEFLDSRAIGKEYSDFDDIAEVRNSLENALKLVNEALKSSFDLNGNC